VLERESDYFRATWSRTPKHLIYMAIVLATLLGAGTAFGTAMVMDSAMDDRRKDVATLRVLGFDERAIAASVLMEGVGLALLGSVAALAIVRLRFGGSLNNVFGSVFRTTVDLPLSCVALLSAVVIALAGTMPLVLKTMRQSPLDGIRELFE
jgi:predicted lysophospholipase L1 biosynthesis ABC-type transport system permease subunit